MFNNKFNLNSFGMKIKINKSIIIKSLVLAQSIVYFQVLKVNFKV